MKEFFTHPLTMIALVGFFQNMVFTLNSRARQSADLKKSFVTAIFSNSVWFISTFILIFPSLKVAIEAGDPNFKWIVMLVYGLATAAGNNLMQAINLGEGKVKGWVIY